MKPWQLGDGDNSVQTPQLRMEFIYDRINNELLAAGINDPTTFAAFATYLGYGSGGCTYQDMQVAWEPASSRFDLKTQIQGWDDIPGLTSLEFRYATSTGGIYLLQSGSCPDLLSISFPNLTSIDSPSNNGSLYIISCPALTTLTAPKLANVSGNFDIENTLCPSMLFPALVTVQVNIWVSTNNAMTSLGFPLLVSAGFQNLNIKNNTLLSSLDMSSYVPLNGKDQNLGGNALNLASVDGFLARCVANAAYVSGTIDISGGTNAAPTQGAGSAHDILVARGVTITHN